MSLLCIAKSISMRGMKRLRRQPPSRPKLERYVCVLYLCAGLESGCCLGGRIPIHPKAALASCLAMILAYYKEPRPGNRQIAVEKMWDAFERLKSYYSAMKKNESADKVISNMAAGQQAYVELFTAEFKTLTKIGNEYRIRHHETDKIEITDLHFYDYFFNRCLSLIALAIQYLQ